VRAQRSRPVALASFCIASRTSLKRRREAAVSAQPIQERNRKTSGTESARGMGRTGGVQLRNAPLHLVGVWTACIEVLLPPLAHPALPRPHVLHGLHADHPPGEPAAPGAARVQRLLVRRDARRRAEEVVGNRAGLGWCPLACPKGVEVLVRRRAEAPAAHGHVGPVSRLEAFRETPSGSRPSADASRNCATPTPNPNSFRRGCEDEGGCLCVCIREVQ
jgi:hypothetical protein